MKMKTASQLLLVVLLLAFVTTTGFAQKRYLIPQEKDGKWGFITSQKEVVIDYQYEETNYFDSNGLCAVKKEGKWGYITQKNKVAIDFQFEEVKRFSKNGLCAVKKEGKWGYIDKKGKYLIPPKYEDAGSFRKENTYVRIADKYGLINENEEKITEMKYDTLIEMGNFFINNIEGAFGVIDSAGQEIIPNIYENIHSYSPKYACIKKEGKWGSLVDGVEDFESEAIFRTPEVMPKFPGCSEGEEKEWKKCADMEMLKFIYQNIKYPKKARRAGIEGTVVLSFEINSTGKIKDAKVVREIGGGCGKEALRIINRMPNWLPGKHEEKFITTVFYLPIKFRLE